MQKGTLVKTSNVSWSMLAASKLTAKSHIVGTVMLRLGSRLFHSLLVQVRSTGSMPSM